MKIILGIIIIYLVYEKCSNKMKFEKMADTTSIEDKINSIYKADIQSIRNLAEISKKLQEGGITVAGDLTVDGNVTSKGNATIKGNFNYLPRGCIIAFNGTNAPQGWALCNGQNGTPDLRGRFIYGHGARQGSSVGRTGGSETHKLNINEMPSHNHGWKGQPNLNGGNFYSAHISSHGQTYTNNTTSTGGNQPHNNMPPYYVLSYIMKL